jgi:anti-sigma B factor antagonist
VPDEDVIQPAAAGASEASVPTPDVAREDAVRSGGDVGDAAGLVAEAGPSRGSGETFEILTAVDGSVVVVVSELDVSTVPTLEAAVETILAEGAGRLVIDASALVFTDSSGVALWVRWANRVGRLEVRDPSPSVRGMLLRMGLTDRLRLTP